MSDSYYSVPGCEGLLQQLQHLLRFGEGLPVVQATHGGGKTSMAEELWVRLHDCPWLTLVNCGQPQDLADLLEQICSGFELQANSGAGESLAALRQFSTQLVNNRELAVLILDDVDVLDDQALGAVLSLLQGNNYPGYGLHLVFFGAPGLVDRVDELALLDAPVYDFEIPHFSPSELSGFLKSRFSGEDSGQLTATVVQGIWGQTMGAPGVAIEIFEQKLSEGTAENDKLAMVRNMPKGHLIALSVLVGVLVWAIFARNTDEPEQKVPEQLVIPALQPSSANQADAHEPKAQTVSGDAASVEGSAVMDKLPAAIADEDELLAQEQKAQLQLKPQAPEIGKPLQALESESGETTAPPQQPKPVQRESVSATNTPQSEAVYQAPPDKMTKDSSTRPTPPTPSGMTANELFLMDQPPETFTLQVIAASRKDALQSYMAAQKNRDDLYMYQSLREGRAWFIVVTGVFASREDAQLAVAGLPEEQKKAGPWPRQLSDVQREIATNRSR